MTAEYEFHFHVKSYYNSNSPVDNDSSYSFYNVYNPVSDTTNDDIGSIETT